MLYIKIPVKTKQEGIEIAEDHFGAMTWRTIGDGSIEAYPYDNNPVVLQQLNAADTSSIECLTIGCGECGAEACWNRRMGAAD